MSDDTNAAVIAGPNYLDATFYEVLVFGGQWLSSAPISELGDPLLSLPAISQDATASATQFCLDLGVTRDIQFIGIPDADISKDGRVRVTATDTPRWAGARLGDAMTVGASTIRLQAGVAAVNIRVGDVFSVAGHTGQFVSNTSANISAGGSAVVAFQAAVASMNSAATASVAVSAALECHTGDFSGVVASVVYAGDWENWWQIIYADGTLPWEHPSQWDGLRTLEDAESYPLPYIKVFSSTAISARYWKFEIDDSTNTNGFITLSRLFISQGWVGEIFIEYGMNLGFETGSQNTYGRSGARFPDEGPQRRVAQFTIPAVDRDEALQQPFDMQNRLGTTQQVFVVLDKDDDVNLHRLAFIGTMRQLPPQEWFWFDANRVPFEIAEDVA